MTPTEELDRPDGQHHRVIIAYDPDIQLSIIAGPEAHSNPKMMMPGLDDYRSVELAFGYKGKLCLPSAAGLGGFDDLFEDNNDQPVAAFISAEVLEDMKSGLADMFGEGKVHVLQGAQ